jgi:MerR family redox-sensitive transcriptional activator SoxR
MSESVGIRYTIGEVARQVGIRPSALRYYERIGLVPAPHRVNGQRRYDEETIRHIRFVLLAQRAGYTIAEQQRLLWGFDEQVPPATRWRALASAKLAELNEVIARAEAIKRVIDETL